MNTERNIYRFTDIQPYQNIVDVGFEPDESGHPTNQGRSRTSSTNYLEQNANNFAEKHSLLIGVAKFVKRINKKTMIVTILGLSFLILSISFIVVFTQNQTLNSQVSQLTDISIMEEKSSPITKNSHVFVIDLPKEEVGPPPSPKKKHRHHPHHNSSSIEHTTAVTPHMTAAPEIHTSTQNSSTGSNTTISPKTNSTKTPEAPTNIKPSVPPGSKPGNDSSSSETNSETENPQGDQAVDQSYTLPDGKLKNPVSILNEKNLLPDFKTELCVDGKTNKGWKAVTTMFDKTYVGYGFSKGDAKKYAAALIVSDLGATYPLTLEEKEKSTKVKANCEETSD